MAPVRRRGCRSRWYPGSLEAPNRLSGRGTAGSLRYAVKPGFDGSFPITAYGLVSAPAQRGEVSADNGEAQEFSSTVPAGTKVARFSAVPDDSRADLDLYVYRIVDGAPVEVGASATVSASESLTLVEPVPGTYVAAVYPYADPPGGEPTGFGFREHLVPSVRLANFSVGPAAATASVGVPLTVTASWSGLTAGQPYLGYVEYADRSGTLIDIN